MSILDSNQSYTFSRYFELGFEASELAQEFGYSLTRKKLNLPQFPDELDRLGELRDRIEEVLPFVPLTNELARREILISRVVTELIHYTQAELRIEYSLKVSNWLQGNLDYLLRVNCVNQLLVIEAKYEDLTRHFVTKVHDRVRNKLMGRPLALHHRLNTQLAQFPNHGMSATPSQEQYFPCASYTKS